MALDGIELYWVYYGLLHAQKMINTAQGRRKECQSAG